MRLTNTVFEVTGNNHCGRVPQREILPNTVPHIPVFGLCIVIRGNTLSKYGNIRNRIR